MNTSTITGFIFYSRVLSEAKDAGYDMYLPHGVLGAEPLPALNYYYLNNYYLKLIK